MRSAVWIGFGTAVAALGVTGGSRVLAQDQTVGEFAAPVRIGAGEGWAGDRRMYPSPALHDVDGDGHADLIVGDLPGRVTVALRTPGEGTIKFGPEQQLKNRRGEQLIFNNW
jgi:hypothetical protein